MSDPKYKPRDYCAEPGGFGRVISVEWLPAPNDRSAALHAAAVLQHHFALGIRQRLAARGLKPQLYAKAAGTGYDRLLKMLRGDVVMRLEDIAIADLILGQVSELARRERDGGSSHVTVTSAGAEVHEVQRRYLALIGAWRADSGPRKTQKADAGFAH